MKKYLIAISLLSTLLHASELDPIVDVYQQLSNIYSPSEEDLLFLQSKLSTTSRPIIERMQDTAFIARNFKLIGAAPHQKPESGWMAINYPENEKENCIIVYSSFNRNYPKGVRRLIDTISRSDFRGHLHYRIGGWPNTAEGDLVLAGVPFAFKVCFFREMRRMGYKRVLWLDASILPWVNLNTIFQLIARRGFFVQANSHDVGIYMNEDSCSFFGVSMEMCRNIWSCSAAIFGIDFTNPKTAPIIDEWHAAAKDPYAFFSARSDQSALSIILYKMGLTDQMWPANTLGEPNHIREGTLFLMDRGYVKDIED